MQVPKRRIPACYYMPTLCHNCHILQWDFEKFPPRGKGSPFQTHPRKRWEPHLHKPISAHFLSPRSNFCINHFHQCKIKLLFIHWFLVFETRIFPGIFAKIAYFCEILSLWEGKPSGGYSGLCQGVTHAVPIDHHYSQNKRMYLLFSLVLNQLPMKSIWVWITEVFCFTMKKHFFRRVLHTSTAHVCHNYFFK